MDRGVHKKKNYMGIINEWFKTVGDARRYRINQIHRLIPSAC